MFSLLIDCEESDGSRDRLVERLWSAGTLGIVEGPTTLEAFFDDESVIEQLADLHPKRTEPEAVDWEEETKRSFPPVLAGERFFLVPPWNQDPTPEGRERLVINPGTACGTGYHPCTQMCLALLETLIRPGMRVADIGAGSGILSKAASLLGAGPIVACDIDPDAVEQCEWPVKFVGSVNALGSGSVDVLVANISAEAHRELMVEYQRVARTLILSGFEQMEPVSGEIERIEQEGWFAIVVKWCVSPQGCCSSWFCRLSRLKHCEWPWSIPRAAPSAGHRSPCTTRPRWWLPRANQRQMDPCKLKLRGPDGTWLWFATGASRSDR